MPECTTQPRLDAHRSLIHAAIAEAIAPDRSLSELSDQELSQLAALQLELDRLPELIQYLGAAEDGWHHALRLGIAESAREIMARLSHSDDMARHTVMIEPLALLLGCAQHTRVAERLLDRYIRAAIGRGDMGWEQQQAFMLAHIRLSRLHRTFDHPDYEYAVGRELADTINADWLSTDWAGVSDDEAIGRVALLNDYDYQSLYDQSIICAGRMLRRHIIEADYAAPATWCRAVIVRSDDVDQIERPFASADLARLRVALWQPQPQTHRLLALRAAALVLYRLHAL